MLLGLCCFSFCSLLAPRAVGPANLCVTSATVLFCILLSVRVPCVVDVTSAEVADVTLTVVFGPVFVNYSC